MGDVSFLSLSSDRVDLWVVRIDPVAVTSWISRCRRLLSPQEVERESRFHFAQDRLRYLVTRALVRTTLSRYAAVPPRNWVFEPSVYGRPIVANDDNAARRISFNVSHADDLIVLALTANQKIGVDVESAQRNIPSDVVSRCFSPDERLVLEGLAPTARRIRTLKLWLLKESYAKARGMGLSIPLDKVSFEFDRLGHCTLTVGDDLDEPLAPWHFRILRPVDDYVAALCIECTWGLPELVVLQSLPFPQESVFDL